MRKNNGEASAWKKYSTVKKKSRQNKSKSSWNDECTGFSSGFQLNKSKCLSQFIDPLSRSRCAQGKHCKRANSLEYAQYAIRWAYMYPKQCLRIRPNEQFPIARVQVIVYEIEIVDHLYRENVSASSICCICLYASIVSVAFGRNLSHFARKIGSAVCTHIWLKSKWINRESDMWK